MGLIFNGYGDVIKAVDGSLTVEGLDLGGSSNVNAGIGTFSGNLNVGGVLTYEDVKNVDSVGIITARAGVKIPDGQNLTLGTDGDVGIKHQSTHFEINNTSGNTYFQSNGAFHLRGKHSGSTESMLIANTGGSVDLYWDGTKKFETTNTGATVTGTLTATTFSGALTGTASGNTTVSNNADNRVITGGSGNALNGESNLTFDGNNLAMSGTGVFTLTRNSRTLTLEGNYGNEGHPAIKTSSGHDLRIFTSGNNERARITSTGEVLIGGHSSAIQPDSYESHLEVHGTATDAGISILRYSANSAGPTLLFGKSRGSSIGAIGEVQENDSLGKIEFYGTDTGWESSASIRASADGEWYSGSAGSEDNTDAPGRLEFHTTPNGADNLQERLRILSGGEVLIGRTTKQNSDSTVEIQDATNTYVRITSGNETGSTGVIFGTSDDHSTGGIFYDGSNDTLLLAGHNNTTRLTISSTGNIGQAVTPSAWSSAQANDFFAYQVGSGTAIFGRASGDEDRGGISANLYCTASDWKYIANGNAGRIYFEDGSIVFNTCDSGSAGATATLNERFKITTDGSVMIGSGTPSEDLHLKKARANFLVEGTNDTVAGNVANINVRAPYYRKAGYSISDAGGNEDFWIGRPYGEGDTTAAVHINMGGTERLRILSGGNVKVSASSASGYIAEFNQTHTSNSGEVLINSPTDSNSRPSLLNFARAGTVKWSAGMGYNDAYNGFHISAGSLGSGIANSKFVVTSTGKVGVGNYAGAGTDPVTALLHVSTNWDNGDVPMVYFKGCNNEAPTSGSTNISFQISDENSNLLHKVWNTGGGNSDLGSVYYAGKMGIGEQTPLRRLHVASDDDLTAFTGGNYGTFAIENSQWDSGDYTAIDFMYNGSAKAVSRIASKITSSGASLHFGVSNNYGTGITHEALVLEYDGDMKGGVNPNDSLWDSGSEKGWYYNRAGGSWQTATPANSGYASWYINKNTGNGGSTDRRYIDFYMNNNQHGRIEHNGASGTNYVTSSDYRLKENVVSITDGITEVKKLKPYRFNFKTDDDSKVVQGFFAHEAQEIVPYAVSGTKDGTKIDERGDNVPDYQDMDYGQLTPLLTAALQEAIAEIETLKAEVAALKSA